MAGFDLVQYDPLTGRLARAYRVRAACSFAATLRGVGATPQQAAPRPRRRGHERHRVGLSPFGQQNAPAAELATGALSRSGVGAESVGDAAEEGFRRVDVSGVALPLVAASIAAVAVPDRAVLFLDPQHHGRRTLPVCGERW